MADELGEELFQTMTTPDVPLLLRIIREKPARCDDGGTRQIETCEDAIALALDRALAWISRRQGADIESWQWGIEHDAAHRHPMFDGGAAPARHRLGALSLGRRCPDPEPRPALLSRQPAVRGHPWRGYRGIYDFSDLDNSRFAMPLRPVRQHAVAMGPQLRPALAEPGLHRDRRQTRELGRCAVGTITLSPPTRRQRASPWRWHAPCFGLLYAWKPHAERLLDRGRSMFHMGRFIGRGYSVHAWNQPWSGTISTD